MYFLYFSVYSDCKEVAALANALALSGKKILVTRARSQASALVQQVEALGGEVWEFPVISIGPPESWDALDDAITRLAEYQWLVITSPNGANSFADRLSAAGKDPGHLAHMKVAAVGLTTEKTLQKLGISVDVVPEEYRGAALPGAMSLLVEPGDRVLMARGNLADLALPEAVRELGAHVDDVVAYQTHKEGGDVEALTAALAWGEIDYITFTSSSTVKNLIDRLEGPGMLLYARLAVIGPETKKAVEAAGLTAHVVAREATIPALVESIAADAASLDEDPEPSEP